MDFETTEPVIVPRPTLEVPHSNITSQANGTAEDTSKIPNYKTIVSSFLFTSFPFDARAHAIEARTLRPEQYRCHLSTRLLSRSPQTRPRDDLIYPLHGIDPPTTILLDASKLDPGYEVQSAHRWSPALGKVLSLHRVSTLGWFGSIFGCLFTCVA